jgi:hypothetical protein
MQDYKIHKHADDKDCQTKQVPKIDFSFKVTARRSFRFSHDSSPVSN